MRILFALPHCPLPTDSGGKQLTLQTIEALTRKHEVAFVVLEGPDPSERLQDLARFGPVVAVPAPHRKSIFHRVAYRVYYVMSGLLGGKPVHSYYGCPGPFWRAVRRQAELWRPDVVHYDFWYSAIREGGTGAYRRVLLEQDVQFVRCWREAELAGSIKRWRLRRVARAVQTAESGVLQKMDCVMAVTPQDARVAKEAGARRVVVFPVAVDIEDKRPPAAEPEHLNILFVGSFVHTPNVDGALWFISDVFPRIVRVHPGATLTIVGADPPKSLLERAGWCPQIRVTGRVPDVAPFYGQSRVVVAPLRFGSGIKVKVLEAMAFGRPVVSTRFGVEGMDLSPGENIFVQDTAEGFAEAVCVLLAHPEQARAVGLAGRALVERVYSKKAAADRILEIYESEAEAKASSGETD